MFKIKVKPGAPILGGHTVITDDIGKAMDMLSGMLGSLPEALLDESLKHVAGIKPPADSRIDQDWTWDGWAAEQRKNDIPGWSFCRFANRAGRQRVGFVFGSVRGNFGIWQQPFRVCSVDADGLDTSSEQKVLTCLTHLRSGQGIGVFDNREVATQAAEMAEKIGQWANIDPDDHSSFGPLYERMATAWAGIGIHISLDSHCHDDVVAPGLMMRIFVRTDEAIMHGRPEKLS